MLSDALRPCAVISAISFLSGGVAFAATLGSYAYQTLDVPGYGIGPIFTEAEAINGKGQVAGVFQPPGDTTHFGIFVWTAGSYQTFLVDVPANSNSDGLFINSISNAGILAGTLTYYQGRSQTPTRYGVTFNINNQRSNVIKIAGAKAFPLVNDSGVLAGTYEAEPYTNGFLKRGSGVTILPEPVSDVASLEVTALARTGEVAGAYTRQSAAGVTGFTYENYTFSEFTFPGYSIFSVNGVNSYGSVVGYLASENSEETFGFLKSGGFSTILAYPGAVGTTALFPVNTSQVVGNFATTGQFYFKTGYNYVSGAYFPISIAGSSDTFIHAANETGTIVGSWVDPTGNSHGFVATCAGGAGACSN